MAGYGKIISGMGTTTTEAAKASGGKSAAWIKRYFESRDIKEDASRRKQVGDALLQIGKTGVSNIEKWGEIEQGAKLAGVDLSEQLPKIKTGRLFSPIGGWKKLGKTEVSGGDYTYDIANLGRIGKLHGVGGRPSVTDVDPSDPSKRLSIGQSGWGDYRFGKDVTAWNDPKAGTPEMPELGAHQETLAGLLEGEVESLGPISQSTLSTEDAYIKSLADKGLKPVRDIPKSETSDYVSDVSEQVRIGGIETREDRFERKYLDEYERNKYLIPEHRGKMGLPTKLREYDINISAGDEYDRMMKSQTDIAEAQYGGTPKHLAGTFDEYKEMSAQDKMRSDEYQALQGNLEPLQYNQSSYTAEDIASEGRYLEHGDRESFKKLHQPGDWAEQVGGNKYSGEINQMLEDWKRDAPLDEEIIDEGEQIASDDFSSGPGVSYDETGELNINAGTWNDAWNLVKSNESIPWGSTFTWNNQRFLKDYKY